jgi:dipeptidase E
MILMKILLTSTGLESQLFADYFVNALKTEASKAKVIFIPTAAIDEEAKNMVPLCMDDLIRCNISSENILTYDLDYLLTYEEGKNFDAVYICGGDTKYLLDRINKIGFASVLSKLLSEGMFFVGVSAGSQICGENYPHNLGYVQRKMEFHCETGSSTGDVNWDGPILLTDSQALVINGEDWKIIDSQELS